jgi:hypothetical protein
MDKQQAEEDAQKALEMHKRAAEAKRVEALKNAFRKFSACPNGLTVPELNVLVAATHNKPSGGTLCVQAE